MNSSVTDELRLNVAVLEREEREGAVEIPLGPQVGIAAIGKRTLDFAVALLALIILSPLILLVALAIAWESGWPVIFAQKRLGQGGRMFTVYKFRSMAKDAEARLADLLEHNAIKDGPTFKLKDDPRITRVGRFIRRTSLDELPQLWNVLMGDMSLVGPRPPLESEVLEYEPWQLQRLAVKPGMTGLWQVSGRSDLGFVEMVHLDLAYINDWSFWRDVSLLARTPLAVIRARGAY
jgi:exopolysaccharide biosynthesis polyprenyl glycosylphosphotransferase